MEIYLIRHTTPQVEKGVCYGQANVDVTETFQKEVARIKGHAPVNYQAFSSPLQRCVKMANHFGVDFQQDDRLKEMAYGDWELVPWSEIERKPLDEWMSDFVNNRPPGGESFNDLKSRVINFWDELTKKESDKPTVIYTHGGVIRVIVCHLLSIPLEKVFQFHLDFGSVTKIGPHYSGLRVEYINR